MSHYQAPSFTDEDQTTTGALTPTSTIGGSHADLHLDSSPNENFQRNLAKINEEIATIRQTCDTALRQCEVLEGVIRKLTESHPNATPDVLTFPGRLLPVLPTSVATLKASSAWVQYGLPREAYQSQTGRPIASQAVWDGLNSSAQEEYESQVRDMVTEVLDDPNFDSANLGEKAFDVLRLIATQSALTEIHPVRKSNGGGEYPWEISIPDLDERLDKVYTAWDDLSRHLFTLRSDKNGSCAVYTTPLTSMKAFPRISLSSKTSNDSRAVRDSLIAAESLTTSLRALASKLSGEKNRYGKP